MVGCSVCYVAFPCVVHLSARCEPGLTFSPPGGDVAELRHEYEQPGGGYRNFLAGNFFETPDIVFGSDTTVAYFTGVQKWT